MDADRQRMGENVNLQPLVTVLFGIGHFHTSSTVCIQPVTKGTGFPDFLQHQLWSMRGELLCR
jgi:hypothetical protein